VTVNVFLPQAGAGYGYAETRLSMIVVDPLQIPSPIDQDHGTTAVNSRHHGREPPGQDAIAAAEVGGIGVAQLPARQPPHAASSRMNVPEDSL
jgi:hypothetical protein